MIGIDASVAAKWIFTEQYSEQARALLRAALSAGERIVAPPLLPIEVTNVIRQRMRQEGLPLPEARQQLAAFLAIPVTLRAPRTLYRRALEIAQEHDLPAAYDAHYVALAERLRCVLWTDDQRLLRALGGRLTFVRSIVDYGP